MLVTPVLLWFFTWLLWARNMPGTKGFHGEEENVIDSWLEGTFVLTLGANAGDTRDVCSIAGLGRSPGRGNDNLLQYSCLESPMDRGAWQGTVHGVTKSQTQVSDWSCGHILTLNSLQALAYTCTSSDPPVKPFTLAQPSWFLLTLKTQVRHHFFQPFLNAEEVPRRCLT